MSGEVVLWVVAGLAVLACLVFAAIFVRFVAKAAVRYARRRPYAAAGFFVVPGGLASFVTASLGANLLISVLVGIITGLAVFLLVAMELGS